MEFLKLYWHVALIATVLCLITIGSFFRFVIPAWRIGRELKQAIVKLGKIKDGNGGHVTDLESVHRQVMISEN